MSIKSVLKKNKIKIQNMKIQNMDAAVRNSHQNPSSTSNTVTKVDEGQKTYKSPVRPVCTQTRWTTGTQKNTQKLQ